MYPKYLYCNRVFHVTQILHALFKKLLLTDGPSAVVAPAPIMPRQDYEFHFVHRP